MSTKKSFDTPHRTTDPLTIASRWHSEGKKVAIARVLSTWGSSPRPAGSVVTVDENSNFSGSVSGGCVEGSVIKEALNLFQNNTTQILKFGVSQNDAWEAGLACGGEIEVLLEKMDPYIINTILFAQQERRPIAWLTNLESFHHSLLIDGQLHHQNGHGELNIEPATLKSIDFMQSYIAESNSGKVFITSFPPTLRLIIIGGVHIAQYLASIATTCGYEVIVIDPRASFGNQKRFPNVKLLCEWPDEALHQLGLDTRTAIVALTHDTKFDDEALSIALKSKAFYIGALGSNKTQKSRLKRLSDKGFTTKQLERIHGPVGLDLGGRAPAEIAVATMAEVIKVLQKEPQWNSST